MSARTVLTVLIMLLLIACGDNAPDGDSRATVTELTTTAESDPLVGRGEVELVDEGYGFTEGPQWMPDDGVLLFTDQGHDTIYQVAADGKITVFRMPSNYSNGLAIDPEGRLIAAERDARRVTRTESDGTVTTIAERFHGALLNQPNDIVVRSDGTIYFTDPTFGDAAAQAELDFRGIFRIAPDGGLTAERRGDTSESPNGLALSPDESLLYVTNYAADLVWVMDVAADGTLSEARTLVTTGDGPDGMAVDNAGNLFVATGSGIEVFSPDGARWGVIPVPRIPANCAFGGADGRTLFITAREGLYLVTLANPGPY
jgi:gluconolactonase